MTSEVFTQLQHALTGHFNVERELPHGGMAYLFAIRDRVTGEALVAKVLAPELGAGVNLERFRREIHVARMLDHPSIVPLLGAGQSENITWYTMPLVDGESLRQRLARERQLALPEVLRIALHVADALDYAAGHNIVHRDIKPDNILLHRDGRAVVTDFGIARAIEKSADVPTVTSTGLTLGTPAYMSPEQAAAERFLDERSDVYSLACVVHEMLVGEPPFTGRTAQAIIARHLHEAPHSLRIVRPDLPSHVDQVVATALAKAPADRYATAGAFIRALEGTGAYAVVASPTTRRGFPVTMAAGIAGVAGVLAWMYLGGPRIPRLTAADVRRVAVLEFEDQSSDRSLGYLASGLTASLVQELTGQGALRVVSRNAMRSMASRGLDADSIAHLLGAGSLVEGSVQRSSDSLRVRVQLVDAQSHAVLDHQTITRPAGELFLIESDLSRHVGTFLRRRIGAEVRLRARETSTRSSRARELVFRAVRVREEAVRRATSSDTADIADALVELRRADSLLALAEVADPAWLLPTIDRGWMALDRAGRQQGGERAASYDDALGHAARALSRVPGHASALELRGTTRYWQAARLSLPDSSFREHLAHALTDLRRSVASDPSLTAARGTLSLVQVARGELAEAVREARAALDVDTYLENASHILLGLYVATMLRGSMAEAWEFCRRGADAFPLDQRFIECQLALMAEDRNHRPRPAVADSLVRVAAERDPPERARATGRAWLPVYRRMMAAIVHARAGDRPRALALLRAVEAEVAGDAELRVDLAYEAALLHLVIGERQTAVRLLEGYLAARPSLRELVGRHARWQPLAGDSSFQRLVGPVTRAVPP